MDAMRIFKAAREYLTPVLHDSAFIERGVLTPEEFVRAGDHLVRTCPTWAWSSGEEGKIKAYLPKDKQFLITKGVPSYRRAVDMNNDELREGAEAGGMGEADADWCISDVVETTAAGAQDAADHVSGQVEALSLHSEGGAVPPIPPASTSAPSAAAAAAAVAVADFEEEDLALDSATVAPVVATGAAASGAGSTVRSARRYDVSITYDKYYQTPRIWLFGYDENGSPLTPERIFDDVISDYSNRTVTLDPHPHVSLPHASVHPCQHGVAMKRVVEELMAGGSAAPSTDQYLFIFLKFMQSVIPTIEFDNTVDVQMKKASG